MKYVVCIHIPSEKKDGKTTMKRKKKKTTAVRGG
jgi:hypothetical protein